MVDFNNETTIGKPPKELVALIIIEKLYNFLEADEDYSKKRLSGAKWPLSTSRARLRNLYLVCYALLKRRLAPEAFEKIRKLCEENGEAQEKDVLQAFKEITTLLDTLGLTKLDDKPVFNRGRVEESNKAQGYG